MTDQKLVLDPRAALEFLGKATEGRSLVEAHAVATNICVRNPSRDEPQDQHTPEEEGVPEESSETE